MKRRVRMRSGLTLDLAVASPAEVSEVLLVLLYQRACREPMTVPFMAYGFHFDSTILLIDGDRTEAL